MKNRKEKSFNDKIRTMAKLFGKTVIQTLISIYMWKARKTVGKNRNPIQFVDIVCDLLVMLNAHGLHALECPTIQKKQSIQNEIVCTKTFSLAFFPRLSNNIRVCVVQLKVKRFRNTSQIDWIKILAKNRANATLSIAMLPINVRKPEKTVYGRLFPHIY